MSQLETLILAGGRIHDYQACGQEMKRILDGDERFSVTYIEEDLDVFADGRLNAYDVLVFYYTVGELTKEQRDGLLDWVAEGHGFVGIHSAADAFRDCPSYHAMIGGRFQNHPKPRTYQVMITDPDHPVTAGLVESDPPEFFVKDEMYVTSYDTRNHVLAQALWRDTTVPVAWVKEWGQGNVFWLALGHDGEACRQQIFADLLRRGTNWAGNVAGRRQE